MCQRINCPKCRKPTWIGCGNHINQVLAGVPAAQRCMCREDAQKVQPAGIPLVKLAKPTPQNTRTQPRR